jgi:hypothetical protein
MWVVLATMMALIDGARSIITQNSVGDQTTAIEVWLPNTMEHPALTLS